MAEWRMTMSAESRPLIAEEVRRLPVIELGSPGEMRDRLAHLVLDGVKTATAGLLVEWELEGEEPPCRGDRWAVVDTAGRRLGVIETTEVRRARMADVDLAFARDEGEGFESVAEWRAGHERFWAGYLEDLRARLHDPTWTIDDDTPLVLERFRLLQRLEVPL
jgi:uncharacterized protein YhfF